MKQFLYLCRLELSETFRARWYQFYLVTIASLISIFFYFGIAESRIMGFTGLGRILLTLILGSIVVLPIFTMMSTVRSLVSDRESGIWEYSLSIPIKLSAFYWSKFFGRYLALFLPLAAGMLLSGFATTLKGFPVSWIVILSYTTFIAANLLCFTGIALMISVYTRTQEMALGLAFILWLVFEIFIDALMLGFIMKYHIKSEFILSIALLNPLQIFRMAAIALFDPELTALGPIAYTILEKLGRYPLLAWAIVWPAIIGIACASIGHYRFKKRDLV